MQLLEQHPNRVLTVQWTNMHVAGSGSSSNPTISMQAQLFENGNIRFIYGGTSATLSSLPLLLVFRVHQEIT